jgi:ketosteroid isomerase-like protein
MRAIAPCREFCAVGSQRRVTGRSRHTGCLSSPSLFAPNYVNVAMRGSDAATVKAMVTATNAALKGQRFEDEELVAEGDVVTARFRYILTLPDNTTAEARALAYYRLSDGRIVVNDVMFDPDLM